MAARSEMFTFSVTVALLLLTSAPLMTCADQSEADCVVPEGRSNPEIVETYEPKGGHICRVPGFIQDRIARCETRFCCGIPCDCTDQLHEFENRCSGSSQKLRCYVEHKTTRFYKNVCCNGTTEDSKRICVDIDECSSNTHDCDQICENTLGSFKCRCRNGFHLAADQKKCNDVDECTEAADCMQNCTNTDGSYYCTCSSGWVLASNGRDCQAVPTSAKPQGTEDVEPHSTSPRVEAAVRRSQSELIGWYLKVIGIPLLLLLLLLLILLLLCIAVYRRRRRRAKSATHISHAYENDIYSVTPTVVLDPSRLRGAYGPPPLPPPLAATGADKKPLPSVAHTVTKEDCEEYGDVTSKAASSAENAVNENIYCEIGAKKR